MGVCVCVCVCVYVCVCVHLGSTRGTADVVKDLGLGNGALSRPASRVELIKHARHLDLVTLRAPLRE